MHGCGHFLGLGGGHESLVRPVLIVPVTDRSRFFLSALVTVRRIQCSSSMRSLLRFWSSDERGAARCWSRAVPPRATSITGLGCVRGLDRPCHRTNTRTNNQRSAVAPGLSTLGVSVVLGDLGHFGIAQLMAPSQLLESHPVLFAGCTVRYRGVARRANYPSATDC